MNSFDLKQVVDQILFSVSQMAGITLPRVIVALVGLLILVLVVAGRWERRVKLVPALLGVLGGGLLVALAVDTSILHWLVNTSFILRIRILLGLLAVLVMAVTFESIRIARLRERYALLWMITSAMVLLAALFPQAIQFLTALLGVQYVTAVVIVVFTFLLLVVFHFSIALSGLEEDRARIAQRCALLELRVEEIERHIGISKQPVSTLKPIHASGAPAAKQIDPGPMRKWRGSEAGSLAVIILSFLAVLLVGLKTSEPLIGDEVTHYFMLKNQARALPEPTFFADIPNGWSGTPEVRRYPHPNGWHYLGAMVDRISGGKFASIQFYHGLLWLQLLVVGFLWSRARGGASNRSSLLYVIVLATIPMNLLFSVSFYQDVPMAAQALTAFYLLDRRRYVWSALFMGLALWIKVTGIIFVLPFIVVAACRLWKDAQTGNMNRYKAPVVFLFALAIIYSFVAMNEWMLKKYADAPYYPAQQIERVIKNVRERILTEKARATPSVDATSGEVNVTPTRPVTAFEAEIIANHPGDLRKPVNFVLYGGVLMWLVLAGGIIGLVRPRSEKIQPGASRRRSWPILVGLFYIVVSYVQLRTAPDARFFLPALPFVALPLCEWCMRLPRARWLLALAAVLGLLQGAYTLKRAGALRQISPGMEEAMNFLKQDPPSPNRVFMYPEGNYRLFPSPHDWYLGYRLREMWTGDNQERLDLLRNFRIGAIVVKKHLIAPLDEDMNNLGIYPPEFVRDMREDSRFTNIFENEAVIIFDVPAPVPGPDSP